jgi:prepilin-type N-terminal cleavage/methylation domain-containing protein
MNRHNNSQSGFTIIEVVLVVVVLAIIGFLGWRFLSSQVTTDKTNDESSQQQEPPIVKSSDDLKSAEDFLNDTEIENTLDTSEIDAALSE